MLVGLLVGLATGSQTAHAALGACSDTSYLQQFSAPTARAPERCELRSRVSVATGEGERDIRLLYAEGVAEDTSPILLSEFERAMQAIPHALQRVGPFRMHPVSILVTSGPDDAPGLPRASLNSQNAAPHASGSNEQTHQFLDIVGSTSLAEGECLVNLHLLSPDARVESAAPVLLHEVFHCVQLATLQAALTHSSGAGQGKGGDWWLEGSAEWFAALALPEADLLQHRLERFDRISAYTPLHEMAYEAVVFFLWLGATREPHAILPFLQRMAANSEGSAQAQAMLTALSLEDWLDFARYYLEGHIAHPHGTPLECDPARGERTLSAAADATIELEPFVLYRGWYEMQCAAAAQGPSAVTADTADAISATRVGVHTSRETFQFLGLATAQARVSLRLESALVEACRPCQGAAAIDACVVGVVF